MEEIFLLKRNSQSESCSRRRACASCRSCFGLAELSLVVTQPGSEISLRSGGLGGGEHVGKERKSQMVVIRYESQRGVTQPSPPPLPLPLFPVFSFHIPF